MAFECKHCGQCCIDECTQINISVGDIVRMCKFLNISIRDIFSRIGIKPFGDPENTNMFDYELGLNIPCEFREGERCKIYPARPLNCRMFPYVFLGNVDSGKLKEVIDPSHKCIVEGIKLSAEEKKKCRAYADFIGKLILEEAELTEQFYTANNLKHSTILPAYVFPAEDPDDPMHAKEITKSKVRMAMQMADKRKYADLQNQLQNFILRFGENIADFDEINKKEREILNSL